MSSSTKVDKEQLLKLARSLNLKRTVETLPAILPAEREQHIPLSFAQQRLWFLSQMEGVSEAYHIPVALRLQGPLDRAALQQALDTILRRHEVLRTTFLMIDIEPVQQILPPERATFQLLYREVDDSSLQQILRQEASAAFDLANGPLIRGQLLHTGPLDHTLLITMHHIVSDGWSMSVLLRELSALYTAFRNQQPDPLAELPIQYVDYALWQRKWVEGDILTQQSNFWNSSLAGAPALLELPTDFQRPAQQDYAGGFTALLLDEQLTNGLRELGRRHGATLYMTLMTAWAILMARLSGQNDIVIGSPTANRGRVEIEDLIGFFVNTLALRIDLSDSPSVGQLITRVRTLVISAQQNQDIPFEQVVELLHPVRSLAHSPLFQVMFAWQNTPQTSLSLEGLQLRPLRTAPQQTAKFDLTLSLQETGDTIRGGIEYATALFHPETVARYLDYFRTLLQAMVEDDHQAVGLLSILPEQERQKILVEWNDTATEFPQQLCIHQMFELQVEKTPEAIAVVFGDDSLSYDGLNRRANRLAHKLRQLGVGPDDRVAICAERSFEMIVALMAVLKAGGAYVPLDPAYPQDRLRFMLDDCQPKVLLTQTQLTDLLPQRDNVHLLALENQWIELNENNPDPSTTGLAPHHLAYIIYTSGSTGTPKGVMVEHRSATNLVTAQITAFDVQPESHVLQFAAFSFDASISEVLMALCRGAALYLIPQLATQDGEALAGAVLKQGITHATLPPAVLAALPDHILLRSIRTMIVAGDALSQALFARWSSGRTFINAYGPTETTVCATVHHCMETDPPHIGRPIANTQIYILDAHGEPVPTGVTGELYIGGAGVARGYLNRPELTAERFLRDPFSSSEGSRMYRTGDLGRWLPDGNIEFLGRNDFQVKIRGFRIELGEIEARLNQIPGIREASVIAREDTPGDKRLVAYYTVSEGEINSEALRASLSASLPDYMVPAAYVRMDAMPLTPNGKLDRKALPAPDADAFAVRAYEPPQGETETLLAAIWQDLLHIEQVGRFDNFFELGGHSLLAVRVAARLQQALSIRIPVSDLFAHPVLSTLASKIGEAIHSELPAILPAEREQHIPLSFAQQRLWFLSQMEGVSEAYHIPVALRLQGPLDREALQQALDTILRRHEVLRTTFLMIDIEPVQQILPPERATFQLLYREVDDSSLQQILRQEASAAFDLANGPLIRGQLLRTGPLDHTLLITMHHIVSDGWSMSVLLRELSALYTAFRNQQPDPLAELPIQYVDYALWQRKWVEGDILTQQSNFWNSSLAGAPALLELPTDFQRPAQQDYAGGFTALLLDEQLTNGLRELGRRHGATLYMTLMTAWAILMARLSGQNDIVIGSPTANRGRVEIEDLIGFFVNTLALRIDLSDSPSVGQLITRVRTLVISAQQNQDIPFEQVVELLHPVRSLAHSPLFQVMFAWQNTPQTSLSLEGLQLRPLRTAPQQTAKFDLTLSLQETGDTIRGGIEYATALFHPETVARYLDYFRTLLQAMVEDDHQAVGLLSILPEQERQKILVEWNDTATEFPQQLCIHQMFELQVEKTPEAIAVVFGDDSLSYDGLNRRANRLAHKLRQLGVGPDDRVAICAERSFEMIVALMAVLKAGGAYVPLDPAYPQDRLRFMLDDCQPKVLLTQTQLTDLLPQRDNVHLLALENQWIELNENNPDPSTTGLTPHHLAYIIYTSGSTGTPKGVMVEHRGIINRIVWMQEAYSLQKCDVVLQKTLFSFDVSVWEFLWPLFVGAELVFAKPDAHKDPIYLHHAIERYRITTVHFVPSMLQIFLDSMEGGRDSSLRRVFCSGEALPARLGQAFTERLPQTTLHNLYGPTEASVDATAWTYIADDTIERSIIPIGRPIANTQIYILDAHGEPVPTGVTGELYIGGAGVARGYLNRPELTAERFLRDPFSSSEGSRMYRTGDLGRWLPDGNIEFLGRNDFQVKIRGFRIELGEIEARLNQIPGIREASVIAREDTPGDKRLVAYYTVSEGEINSEALRASLSASLPDYMVPAAYVRMDAMPLTPNGKLDRKALPAPDADAFAVRAYEPPQGETETLLAAIWQDLLHIEQVGRFDDFFELGGHSLLAVRVAARLQQALSIEVAILDILSYPVLSDLASKIGEAIHSELPAILPAEREQHIPLSFAQQRLWFLSQMEGVSEAYHIPVALRLQGPLDRAALQQALDTILRRHEVLRTTFLMIDIEPVQQILPPERATFQLLYREVDDSSLQQILRQEASAAFDLANGPLIRGQLLRTGPLDHTLLITMHHIVSDGWSMSVLLRELSALYTAFRNQQPDPLAELPIQYVDYALWQRKWVEGDILTQQSNFWNSSLAGAPALLELPTDFQRPAQQDYAGGFTALLLDEQLTNGLRELGRRHGATLYMTLMTAWAILMARLSGQNDIVIGSPTANRGRVEIEDLIGFFVNTLALRIDLSDSPSVGQLITRVRTLVISAQQNQDIPFEQVVELLHPVRSLAHSPLFQVMFAWQNTPQTSLSLEGLQLRPLRTAPQQTAKFDLTLSLQETGDTIRGGIEYATALFHPETVARYLDYFRTLLQTMVEDDHQAVGLLSILPEQERQKILVEWNDTATEFPQQLCIHQMFELQVEKTPEAIAVVFGDDSLSYDGLNRRANRLAHKLRQLGVGPDDRVAICAERSFEMIVALMAVLKAGGAYVPLDPAYPQDRLRFMLDDCQPKVLLTQTQLTDLLPQRDNVHLLALENQWIELNENNPDPSTTGLAPHHLAYIIYTSGSTGTPKGVMVEHRSSANLIHWARQSFPPTILEATLFSTSLSFDLAIYECFVPLSAGALIEVVTNLFDLSRVRSSVTLVNTVPSAIAAYIENADLPRSIRTINVAGEPLHKVLTERLFSKTNIGEIYNLYGPTETTTYSTCVRVEPGKPFPPHIGRPIANTQIYILDAHGEPVPTGVTGELYIGGAGVARGYLNRPELTAERFLRDPFSSSEGSRMYRTGDLGRWLPDGNIEFLGRNDFQVKIRGFRIELGEIEARLNQIPGIREASVIAREDTPGDKRLVAYYTVSEGEINSEALRASLSASLPDYMVPAAYVRMDAMPLTPNGKLDRKTLPAPDADAFAVRAYEPPQGETETLLAAIWQDLLHIEQVGRFDNFFELGGHSLLAVTLIERMRRSGLRTDVRSIFAAPTLAQLASSLSSEISLVQVPPSLIPEQTEHITPDMLTLVRLNRQEIDQILSHVPGRAANLQDIYPLAPLQEGILFHHLMAGEGDPYLLAALFSFDSRDRLDRHLEAMQAVMDRHDILRTAVLWEGLPEPVQVVLRKATLPVEQIHFSATGDIAEQMYRRFNPRSFRIDIRKAPLLRIYIAEDPVNQRWLMLQHLHHLVGDHTTLEVMQREMQAYLLGHSDRLPQPLPFRNLVAQARLGISQQEHTDFFRQMLADVDEPTAPFGLLDVRGDGSGLEENRLKLHPALASRMRARARRLGVSVASLCHLAWAQVLARTSGRSDVVFGTVLFGRMQGGEGSDRVMGLFINTLPLRISIGEQPVETAVRHTHTLLANLIRHEHASLAMAQKCSAVPPPTPLFSALLNYRHSSAAARAEDNSQQKPGIRLLRGEERTNYPFTLSVDDLGEGFLLTSQVPASIGAERVCNFMETALQALLQALDTNPSMPLRAIDVLPEQERQKILVEWNDTATEFPQQLCIHQMFELQVEKTPEAIAVVFGDDSLSYDGLNRRANRLAHKLRQLGVGPDDRVAILLERSIDLVTAEIAVLKCGASFVPLDPTFPRERIEFILNDSHAKAILCSSGATVPHSAMGTIHIDRLDWQALPQDNISGSLPTQSIAYVMYTSGSTGVPKGVMVPHAAVINLALNNSYAHIAEGHRVAFAANPAFDATTMEVWAPLLRGGCIVVFEQDKLFDPIQFGQMLREQQVKVLWLTAGLFHQYVDIIAKDLSMLNYLIVGGDALDSKIVKRLIQGTAPAHLINGYGPTETTTFAATYEIRSVFRHNIPIGRPIANTQIYILDAHGEPVPTGVTGELYIGGAGVARGYLNRPELTAERFLRDPFSSSEGSRMYRTGDLGRWLPDGNIEFLGRNDFQVKIRGFRIELGEIEARLNQIPGIREASVIAREDTPGDKRLVAYYTVSEGEINSEALRASLSASLPDYMVPAAYVRMDAMPLTPNGKLDRKTLPAPDADAFAVRAYEPPQGETETLLAAIWQDLLHIEQVGRFDNFFELGGHSLLAVTLIERMRRSGLRTDVRSIFAAPTLAQLASSFSSEISLVQVPPSLIPEQTEHITPDMLTLVRLNRQEIDQILSHVPGRAANLQDIYPLAPLQEGILFHHLMAGEGDPYLLAALFSFDSRDRLDRHLEAMQAVMDRHDILRTAVLWEGLPEPVQVVLRKATLPVEQIHFSATGDIAEQMYRRFNPRSFRIDIRKAPLLRIYIAEDPVNQRWLMLQHLHHLVGDHTTLEVMQREMQAYLLGHSDRLPQPLPFRNLVAQARLGISQQEHTDFFRQMLADVDEPTAPFGLLDVRGDGSGLEENRLKLHPALASRMRARARRLGVSVASLCHLAWAQVLARTSGRSDVVFGTVLFGRMQGGEGSDRVMGLFINTLPLRISIGEQPVETAVRHTHTLLANLIRHEHASLAMAQKCSAVPPPTPLFSALLNYRHSSAAARAEDNSQQKPGIRLLRGEERTNYPFTLSVDDLGEGFLLTSQVPASIGAERVCNFMETALQALLQALDTNPSMPLRAIDVLPEQERQKILVEWNDTATEFPQQLCIHQMFELQVEKTPEAIAVVFGDDSLSYDGLNRRANRLAHKLRQLGVGPDDRVAICAERSFEMIVALMAVLKAGGAYVPLDPAYPQDRLRFMLDDCQPKVLLTQTQLTDLLPQRDNVHLLALENQWIELNENNPDPSTTGLAPHHLAYIIYTSGSTGTPKGVMVEHRNISRLFSATAPWFQFAGNDKWALFHSYAFDFSVWEIWGALVHGGELVLVPLSVARSPEDFSTFIRKNGITILNQTPSAFRQLLDEQRGGFKAHDVRHVILGGEALDLKILSAEFWSNHSHPQFTNMYGITEITVHATYYRALLQEVTKDLQKCPIGKRLPDLQIYILDAHGEPVPIGVTGELYIGGAGVARGYLNRPELTAERFLRDPFSSSEGSRMYRTGDLGRWLPDGNIEFLGRNDFQVKIRGFRIELGEIEARLNQIPGIREASVIAREDTPGDKRLVAYYTVSEGEINSEALRASLSASLPDYMVPAAYVRMDAMPLTPNGKLDRKALPAPDADAFAVRAYEPPQGETETLLAAIWQDLLHIEQVGRFDNFFELGGHSLLAVRVAARLQQALSIRIPVSDLFAHPVLSTLASKIGEAIHSELPAILPAEREQHIPLSFAQQRLWFLSQMEGVSEAYHIPVALRLQGPLDREALQQALDTILRRHEVLRTTFLMIDIEPVQQILPPERATFQLLYREVDDSSLQQILRQEASAAFDLANGPLIRGQLLHTGPLDHTLLITMHHIVSDGWSMSVLLRELSALYTAFRNQQPDPLAELPIQYVDYALWQRKWVEGDILTQQSNFWNSSLAGAPALLELPTDFQRPAQQDYAGGFTALLLDEQLTNGLRELGRRHGATLYMTLMTAWAILMARLSGQNDIVIGSPTANRGRVEIEDLIGFFVNTLALRIDLSDSPSVGQLITRVRTLVISAQQNQDIPFEQVVELLHPVRSLAHSPLFQVMFAWQNTPQTSLSLEGLQLRPLRTAPQQTAKFDLTLSLQETGDTIRGGIEYATALFHPETVARYLDYFRTLLQTMVEDDHQAVGLLSILPEQERQKILVEWNDTATEFPQQLCIHQMFELQVEKTPEAIAVVFGDDSLSYDGLNRRANRLAHKLRQLGVGPDDRVAICAERSFEMIVALMAVLKAGGAYVPLDPAYPQDRLRFMLDDCQPKVLLTQTQLTDLLPQRDNVHLLALENQWIELNENNPDPSTTGLTPHHLAYIIYTSGSTGTPKGVMVEHRNVANSTYARTSAYTQLGRFLLLSSLSFDSSVAGIFGSLTNSGTLIISSQDIARDPLLLSETIESLSISSLLCIPSAYKALLEFFIPSRNSSLKTVVLAGEIVPKHLVDRSLSRKPGIHLLNEYGPTETTVWASLHCCKKHDMRSIIPIGRPIANTQIYILDAHGEPVPTGVTGELYIGGAGVARGYLNRPELTAERFLRDPFSSSEGSRMYRTGDLGRWLPDGNIEFLGRNDFQVKIRGFRIELGEIEARLNQIPGIREASVIAREDTPGDKRLVAYYTVSEGEINSEALRASLSASLPDYMVPAAYVRMDAMPLTPNGKLDRKTLPAPDADAFAVRAYEPPQGETETLLAAIWQDLLHIEQVGRFDNFFELGGHSLLAVTLIERMRRSGLRTDVRSIFAAPTLTQLALELESNVTNNTQSTSTNQKVQIYI